MVGAHYEVYMSLIRKCSICKKQICLDDKTIDFFILEKNGTNSYTHSDCYIKYHTSKKRNPKTIEECQNIINQCKTNGILEKLLLEEQERNQKAQDKINKEKEKNIRIQVTDFIFDFYGISFLPQSFYVKLDAVYNGTFKGLSRPVLPEDLLDMWQQKKTYLLKVAEQNRKKDKDLYGVSRVSYDLAILLSKYDSYLAWKEEQKQALILEEESKKKDIEKIEYKDVIRPQNNINTKRVMDITSMLDEI